MFTERDYISQGRALSEEANVIGSLHNYFLDSYSRLYKTLIKFRLLESQLGDTLEIGPFYGYVPFVLRPRASSYTVLEGDDPAAYPLKPLYGKRGIGLSYVDLFEMFGPTHSATHSLGFQDASFDTILCWETMEHFNFNPIKFVREVRRVLRPGGKVYITVPNKASFQNICTLLFGRWEDHYIDGYYAYEDYISNGKKAFYGFHWREYSGTELARVFTKAEFSVQECGTFVAFHDRQLSLAGQAARVASRVFSTLLPRFGTNVYLVARK